MPQISLYVDEKTMADLRANAAAEHVSISKYVGRVMQDQAATKGYPQGFFALYGSMAAADFERPEDPAPKPTEPLFA